MTNDLVKGLLDDKWYCHVDQYVPHPDPSSKDEEVLCPDCLKKIRRNTNA